MKPEVDQALDQLLRRHAARRDADPRHPAPAPADRSRAFAPDEHLDADELSAFAENRLPPAARARYLTHLADCSACRQVVAAVASATDTAGELERAFGPPPAVSSWRRLLGRFFAAPALRYALPVLAFVVLAGVVWRYIQLPASQQSVISEPASRSTGEKAGALVAETGREATVPAAPPTGAKREAAADGQNRGAAARPEDRTGTSENAPAGTAAKKAPSASAPPPASEVAEETRNPLLQSTNELDQNQIAQQQPEETQKREQGETATKSLPVVSGGSGPAKEKRSTRENAETSRTESGAAQSPSPSDTAAPAAPPGEAPARPRVYGRRARELKDQEQNKAADERARGAEARDDERAPESRSLGGRRFVRRGNVWVDTAYQAQPVINVARGSEQYRALVADEPGLGAIATELKGEVLVVWRGRAYRLR